jgi:SAM-dependent methyltransferase
MIQTPFQERGSDYYDRVYSDGTPMPKHQPVYDAVVDCLGRMQAPRVLEMGCGDGELALEIVSRGIPYRGFDLSGVAIARGRTRGLTSVVVGSAYDPESYLPHDYNTILALGVFEHLEDRRALHHIPEGMQVLFSVPDFVETSHLRTYQDPQRDIVDYYAGLLTVGQVRPFRFDSPAGITLTVFLAHAVKGTGPCPNLLAP